MSPETKKRSVGTVTVLFTDVVGSTELLDRDGDDVADSVRRKHFKRLRQLVRAFGGTEVKSLGDGLMVVFPSASDAAGCAVAIQQATATDPDALPVRVGLHTGEAVWEEDDLYGKPVVVARRLCDRAEGGQILASELVRGLIGRRGNFSFNDLGFLELKGFRTPVPAAEVLWRDHPTELVEPEPVRTDGSRRSLVTAVATSVLVLLAALAAVVILTDGDDPPDSSIRGSVHSDPRLGSISVQWATEDLGVEAGAPGEQIMLDLTTHRGQLLAPGRDEVAGDLQATMWTRDGAGVWSKVYLDGTEPRPGDDMVFGVVGRGRTLVAVGSDGAPNARDAATWISTDLGRRWTRTDEGLSVPGNETMFAVADNGRRFVAVGFASSAPGQADAAIWQSRNGRSWTRVPDDAMFGGPGRGEASDVISSPRGFVAVGGTDIAGTEDAGDASVWLSRDGLDWERADSPEFFRPQGQRMMSIVRTPPGFLAAGFDSAAGNMDAALWSSPDARTWTRVPHDEASLGGVNDQIIFTLTKGPGFFAALGKDGTEGSEDAALWVSLNGVDWRRMPHDETVLGGDGVQEVRGTVIDGMEVIGAGATEESGDPDGSVWRAKVEGL